jgi:hypothetical protein
MTDHNALTCSAPREDDRKLPTDCALPSISMLSIGRIFQKVNREKSGLANPCALDGEVAEA